MREISWLSGELHILVSEGLPELSKSLIHKDSVLTSQETQWVSIPNTEALVLFKN
jgi:hypothetical protein